MDLKFAPEQDELRSIFTAMLEKHCGPEAVREAEPLGFDDNLWGRVCEVGLSGLGVAEAQGGSGGGFLDLAVVAEACGRSLAPVPFVEAPVAARIVEAVGGAGLAAILEGAPVTFAPLPGLDGVARLAPFGAIAPWVVALDGDQLVLVGNSAKRAVIPNLGNVALSDVPLRADLGATSVEVLAKGDDARKAFARGQAEWRILLAAALTGLAARALEIGVDYAKERKQFGVPIGSFQSVAHELANVATEVDGATLLWQEAAWAWGADEASGPKLSHMAFVNATEVAMRSAEASLHFHGGYGFMLEYDIQLYVRRAKAWPKAGGSRRFAVAAMADELYGKGKA